METMVEKLNDFTEAQRAVMDVKKYHESLYGRSIELVVGDWPYS